MGVLQSAIGFAPQATKGTPITTNSAFTYILANQMGGGPAETRIPLPLEMGGSAMLRGVFKTGVASGFGATIIPRATSLGWLLFGVTGAASSPSNLGGGLYQHTFTFAADELALPWFTARKAISTIKGEQFADVKFANLTLSLGARDFLRGDVGCVGITPAMTADVNWDIDTYIDDGEVFLAGDAIVTPPTGISTLEILGAEFNFLNVIPVDPQFKIGSYYPRDLQAQSRAAFLTFTCHLTRELYNEIAYDPAGTNNWTVDIFEDGAFNLKAFDQNVEQYVEFSFNTGEANLRWGIEPVALTGNDPIITARVTAAVVDTTSGFPYTIKLANTRSAQYATP